jgi:hypothetical protein
VDGTKVDLKTLAWEGVDWIRVDWNTHFPQAVVMTVTNHHFRYKQKKKKVLNEPSEYQLLKKKFALGSLLLD